jgi:hypothetical protein
LLLNEFRAGIVGSRDQNIGGIIEKRLRDRDHLFRRLALGEDDFGHPVAERAMVVHFCESQVLKRHVPHTFHGRVYFYGPASNLLEERPELLLIHEARISE